MYLWDVHYTLEALHAVLFVISTGRGSALLLHVPETRLPTFTSSLPRRRPPALLTSGLCVLALVFRKLLKKSKHTVTLGNALIFTEMQNALLENS